MSFFAATEVCVKRRDDDKQAFYQRRMLVPVLNVERIDELQSDDAGDEGLYYANGARCLIELRTEIVYVAETIEQLFERTCK